MFVSCSPILDSWQTCEPTSSRLRTANHAVEVSAGSLFQAAALAIAEFRRCGFRDANPGRATRRTVALKTPTTRHQLSVGKLQDWLNGEARSPKELVLKSRLKEIIG